MKQAACIVELEANHWKHICLTSWKIFLGRYQLQKFFIEMKRLAITNRILRIWKKLLINF